MKIFGAALSPFVRKVMVYCAEREIAFDHAPIFPMGPDAENPEFKAASPMAKIPAMEDEGYTLVDSSAIIHYLEAKHGSALIPDDAKARGTAIYFDEIADTVFAGAIGAVFFNRVVAPKFMGREGDTVAANLAENETIPALLEKLEAQIPQDGDFLVGDALTIADISMAGGFVNMKHGGILVDEAKFPRTANWLAGIWARPSFAAQIAMEEKIAG